MFCVNRINLLPSMQFNKKSCARERLDGLKEKMKKDMRVGFGEYV